MERNQTLSIALGTAGVGCTLAYLAYSHWENDKDLKAVSVDDVGKEAVIEDNKNNEKEEGGAWYDFIFSNSNTENEEGTQIQKKNEWDSNITLKPENKKMVKSALKDTLKQQFNESN